MSAAVTESPRTMLHAQVVVRSRTTAGRLVRFGTISVLLAAPLAFGATTVTASVLLAALSWMIALVWIAQSIRNEELSLSTWPVAIPAAALLAFTAVHWVTGLSASRDATQLEWLRWAGYIALAIAAGESFVTPARLARLAKALAVAGFLIATFALVQYATGNGKIYWLVEPSLGGWIFGPYVNRNHFAGLMELWIPIALGLALIPENTVMRRWLWCSMAMVMGAAVAMSGSRGGMLAVAVEVTLLTMFAAAFRGGRRALAGLVIALVVCGALVWSLDRGEVFERYKQSLGPQMLQQSEAGAYRLNAWRGSMEIFKQNWLLGTGLDTFAVHFPAVRDFSTDKIWTHAHNDFLQFAAETGVIGIGIALWILVAGGREAWGNIARTQSTAQGMILIGAACACVGFLVHGWLDFNFHVPANASSFAVLAAVLTRRGWDAD